MDLKKDGVHFVLCPKQGNKIEVIVLKRVCIYAGAPGLRNCCSKQGQGIKMSATHLSPNIDRVPPPPPPPPPPRRIELIIQCPRNAQFRSSYTSNMHAKLITGLPVAQPSYKFGSVFPSGTNRTLACSARTQDLRVCVE